MNRFIEGAKIRIESLDGKVHEYIIASREGEEFQLDSLLVESRTLEFSLTELQELLAKGRLQFIASTEDEDKRLAADLMTLPEEVREESLRRYKYVTGLINRGVQYWSPQYIEDLLPEVAVELQDPKPPSWLTIWRWHKQYVQANYSILGLYPANYKKGNRKSRLKKEVDECIKKAIAYYQDETRPDARDAYDRLEEYLVEANTIRHKDDLLPIPSYRNFLKRLEKVTPYEIIKTRHGKRKADIEYNSMKAGIVTERVMERVCVDHTKLDLFVIDSEISVPIGRPWLTLAVDEYSRSIVGAYISFKDPDFGVILKLIRNTIEPKDYIAEKYPFVKNKWHCYGCPELFVFDNGKEFWCKDLEIVLAELNIQYEFNPVRSPWLKGKVERKFGTINTNLLSRMPGKTFCSIEKREDYDPKKNAQIKFDEFIDIFYSWLIDQYQQSETTEEKLIPDIVWLDSIEEYPPKMVEPDRLNIILGRTEESKLRHGGIYFKKIRYDSDELAAYRSKVGNGKASYKVNPDNLDFIYVFNTLERKYIKVNSVVRPYTCSLREHQHDVHLRAAKENAGPQCSMEDIIKARIQTQRMIAENAENWMKSPNKISISDCSAAAKYCNVSQDGNASILQALDSSCFEKKAAPEPCKNPPQKEPKLEQLSAISFDDDDLNDEGWSND